MKKLTKIFSTIALVVITLISDSSCKQMKDESKTQACAIDAVTLKADMRKLWEDHVIWTRNVILCIADELPGKSQAVKRLLQNQVDIGNLFKLYYGEEIGSRLTKLLFVHINTFAEVAQAAKTNNTLVHDEANKRLVANADEISELLCKVNPNWALTDMKMMMQEHLKITTDEAMQRINKNYDADVIAFDKTNKEILSMADMFTDGIIKQFPEKF
jgi:hypothetical protein